MDVVAKKIKCICRETNSDYPSSLFLCVICTEFMKRTHIGVAMSVRMIQLENSWTDLDEILFGCYANGVYSKIIRFYFLQLVITTWRTNELVLQNDVWL
jgi:hypothetical protein